MKSTKTTVAVAAAAARASSGDDGDDGNPSSSSSDSSTSFSFDPTLPAAPLLRMDQPLYAYLLRHTREPAHLLKLREETARFAGPRARNAVSPEQGSFLRWLVASLGATRALEVGVFTGYSSVAIASALPPASEGGLLLALERDARPLELARRAWAAAAVDDRVRAVVGDAREELARLVAEKEEADEAAAASSSSPVPPFPPFDFAFIDADKRGYISYFESCLRLVRKGGVIAIDNVLWYGRVAAAAEEEEEREPAAAAEEAGGSGGEGGDSQRRKKKKEEKAAAQQRAATEAVRELNARLLADERIDLSIIPVGDGIALCRKL